MKDFGETAIDVELLFDDRHEQVDADGNPDLRLHGILACSVESLDAQVLLDPLEEDLNVPSTLVQLSDGQCGQSEIVGEEDDPLVIRFVEKGILRRGSG